MKRNTASRKCEVTTPVVKPGVGNANGVKPRTSQWPLVWADVWCQAPRESLNLPCSGPEKPVPSWRDLVWEHCESNSLCQILPSSWVFALWRGFREIPSRISIAAKHLCKVCFKRCCFWEDMLRDEFPFPFKLSNVSLILWIDFK